MRRVLVTGAIGVIVGAVAGLLATSWLQSLLYGIRPRDALSFSLSTTTLVVVIVVAAFIPARRATRVDPMTVLRGD
jgi:ABC-type antimicrobial peptide transport system permease subunit